MIGPIGWASFFLFFLLYLSFFFLFLGCTNFLNERNKVFIYLFIFYLLFFYISFFFRSCSRQEIILSALIGQFRVSNLRRVAFIFHWPIVHRLHNTLSITHSPISKQSTPLNTSPASKCNLPLFHPKFVSKYLHCFLKSAPSVQLWSLYQISLTGLEISLFSLHVSIAVWKLVLAKQSKLPRF